MQVAPTVVAVASVVAAGFCLHRLTLAKASARWPSTQGKVVASSIEAATQDEIRPTPRSSPTNSRWAAIPLSPPTFIPAGRCRGHGRARPRLRAPDRSPPPAGLGGRGLRLAGESRPFLPAPETLSRSVRRPGALALRRSPGRALCRPGLTRHRSPRRDRTRSSPRSGSPPRTSGPPVEERTSA